MVSLNEIGPAVAAAGTIGTTAVGIRKVLRKNESLRGRIMSDLELRKALTDKTPAAEAMDSHIHESVETLVSLQKQQMRRAWDPYMLIWCGIFAAIALGVGYAAISTDRGTGWRVGFWLFAAFMVLLTVIGLLAAHKEPDDVKDSKKTR